MHDKWQDQMPFYLTGRLSESEQVALETHLAECEACRTVLRQLHAAAVAVVVPGSEMEHHPQRRRAAFDATLARQAGDNLRDRNPAAPQMVLELKLEDDPVPVGIAPAPAKHVPRAAGIFHQKIDVPRACGQPSHQAGPGQGPPCQGWQRPIGLSTHTVKPNSSGQIVSISFLPDATGALITCRSEHWPVVKAVVPAQ